MSDNNQTFEQDMAKEQTVTVSQALTQQAVNMNQLLGRIQAVKSISSTLEALSLVQLQEIKETKSYHHLKGQEQLIDGVYHDLGTWDGFCKAIGTSRRSVDEDLQNLNLLGEEALNNSQKIGLTTKDLRKLRKLDTEDQKVVINEIETNIGDKESIIELIEDMSVKYAKEKDELKKQVKERDKEIKNLNAENQANERIIQDKDAIINKKTKELEIKLDAPVHKRALPFLKTLNNDISLAIAPCLEEFKSLYQQVEQDEEVLNLIRVNLGHALLEIRSKTNDLLDEYGLHNTVNYEPATDIFEMVAEKSKQEEDSQD